MIWRRIKVPSLISETISPDYIVLYWRNGINPDPGSCSSNEIVAVGSNYFMNLYPSSWMEPRHPFTTFKNRSGNCDFLVNASGQKRSKIPMVLASVYFITIASLASVFSQKPGLIRRGLQRPEMKHPSVEDLPSPSGVLSKAMSQISFPRHY